ncbi:MAG: deoxyribonuclease IV [Candidatus Latescibacterota bacterium]|nr:MAG: deoxyribonuclease IV [Candidatus Latescibacterota bacterium]
MARGIAHAEMLGCTALQVFVKNQQRWVGRSLGDDDVAAWRDERVRELVRGSLAHASYLINLGSPDDILWRRSRHAMHDEMQRCQQLGIPALVVHPGAHVGSGAQRALRRIARALRWLLGRKDAAHVSILLECTAGQGTSLGHRFEHLAWLIDESGASKRLGVCIDTCHLLAAGYDLRGNYESVFDELDQVVGLERVRAFHLNDSKCPLGGRVDRHAGIGQGHLGRAFFRKLLRDARFERIPMVLETPGGLEGDRRNLRLLRSFLRGRVRRA